MLGSAKQAGFKPEGGANSFPLHSGLLCDPNMTYVKVDHDVM